MKLQIGLQLEADAAATDRLLRLQSVFAQACNLVSPIARAHHCWNRVALHHLTYRQLRQTFPQLGSQMSCNAVFAVSRACRLVYTRDAHAPVAGTLEAKNLPHIHFMPDAPVYFDRHTMALNGTAISLFTLEGRLRCQTDITPTLATHIDTGRIEEATLYRRNGRYSLDYLIETDQAVARAGARRQKVPKHLPEQVIVRDDAPQDLRLLGDARP